MKTKLLNIETMTKQEFYKGWTIMVVLAADDLHLIIVKNGMELSVPAYNWKDEESAAGSAKAAIDIYEESV